MKIQLIDKNMKPVYEGELDKAEEKGLLRWKGRFFVWTHTGKMDILTFHETEACEVEPESERTIAAEQSDGSIAHFRL